MSPPWEVQHSRTLLENPWFSVLRRQIRSPDGQLHDYHSVHFPRPAVGVIARNGDRVLLIRQYRVLVEEFVWAIPSGGVEPGESNEAAALRELLEETGHRAGQIRPLLGYYPSYGATDQRFEIFVADEVEPAGVDFDRTEVIETRWFSRPELIDLIRQRGVVDGLSLTPLALLLLEEELDRAP